MVGRGQTGGQCLDRSHHNTPPGHTGPLVRRLQGYGKLEELVVGPLGEGSKDIHSLVKIIAETKAELGIVVFQVRKYLSISFIRAQSLCLLYRLCFLFEGAVEAAGRRDLTSRSDEGSRRDRQASFVAHIRGVACLERVRSLFSRS